MGLDFGVNRDHVQKQCSLVADQSAQLNSELNQLSNKITVQQNNLLVGIHKQADLVVANILAHIIEQLIDDAWINLVEGGYFIASGIIQAKKTNLLKKLEQKGFKIVQVKAENDWICIIAQKRSTQ